MNKYFKKTIYVIICIIIIAAVSFGMWMSNKYVVPIMMYHSVNYSDGHNGNIVSPDNFKRHMEFLKLHKYNVISLAELADGLRAKKDFKKNTVVITFDDGYEDNYRYAFPELKRLGFPATIFVPSDQLGIPEYLSAAELQEMKRFGISTGSHTKSHAYLPGVNQAQQREQIVGSKDVLEKALGFPVSHIAYPTGGFDENIKALVKKSGYSAACTTNRGFDRSNRDLYELKRIRFGNKDISDFGLWVKLSGYYNFFRKSKNPS